MEHNALWDLESDFQAKHDRLWFNPAVSGTHYIKIRGTGGTGRYFVFITDVDIEEETNTKGRITVDGEARSRVNYNGDIDRFKVSLGNGDTYRIELKGATGGVQGGSLQNPELKGVYKSNGAFVPNTDDHGGLVNNSQVEFTAPETGTFYIAASGYHDPDNDHPKVRGRDYMGTYTLTLTAIGVSEPAGEAFPVDATTKGLLAVGAPVTGNINIANDADAYRVELEADVRYRFDLEGSETSSVTLADPIIDSVLDAGGRALRNRDVINPVHDQR